MDRNTTIQERIANSKLTKADIRKMKRNNLDFFIVRIFTMVPTNSVLICENKFTGEKSVKGAGLRFNLPWVKSRGILLDVKNYDFVPQKIESKEGFDVILDAAVSYKISGGIEPTIEINTNGEKEIIKTKDKEIRRRWQREHGALKVNYDFNNNPSRVQKQIEIILYDYLRKYCAKHDYEFLKINSIDKEDPDYIAAIEKLKNVGIELVDIEFKNINQTKEVDEAAAKIKIAEAEKIATITKAQAEAETIEIKATAEAERIKKLRDAGMPVEALTLNALSDKQNAHVFITPGSNNLQNAAIQSEVINTMGGNTEPEQVASINQLFNKLEELEKNTKTAKPVVSGPNNQYLLDEATLMQIMSALKTSLNNVKNNDISIDGLEQKIEENTNSSLFDRLEETEERTKHLENIEASLNNAEKNEEEIITPVEQKEDSTELFDEQPSALNSLTDDQLFNYYGIENNNIIKEQQPIVEPIVEEEPLLGEVTISESKKEEIRDALEQAKQSLISEKIEENNKIKTIER